MSNAAHPWRGFLPTLGIITLGIKGPWNPAEVTGSRNPRMGLGHLTKKWRRNLMGKWGLEFWKISPGENFGKDLGKKGEILGGNCVGKPSFKNP